jgi:hypothetical protein
MLNDQGNIGGIVMQGKVRHRSSATSDFRVAAAQHSKAIRCQLRSYGIVVFRASSKRRQDHYDGPEPCARTSDADFAPAYHFVRDFRLCLYGIRRARKRAELMSRTNGNER